MAELKYKDGWSFERSPQGNIKITAKDQNGGPASKVISEIVIPSHDWAKICAGISLYSDEDFAKKIMNMLYGNC